MKKILNSVPGFLELVFENRNKEYGAYAIRVSYESRLRNSLLIAMFIAASLTLTVIILNHVAPSIVDDLPTLGKDVGKKIVQISVIPNFSIPDDVTEVTNHNPVRVVDKASTKKPLKKRMVVVGHSTGNADIMGLDKKSGEGNGHAAQIGGPTPLILPTEEPIQMETADVYPEFPGGDVKLQEYLRSHLSFTESARTVGIHGKVYIQFIVDADGSVRDAKLLKGLGYGLDEQALKAVTEMPDWKPGKQGNRKVSVYIKLPIQFSLQ